jgi:hypothetical protein
MAYFVGRKIKRTQGNEPAELVTHTSAISRKYFKWDEIHILIARTICGT